MKNILAILFVLCSFVATSQPILPRGLPYPFNTGFSRTGYLITDSAGGFARRDTNWTPRYVGMYVYWEHAGVDTALWVWQPYWKRVTVTQAELNKLSDDARYLHITGGIMTGAILSRGSIGSITDPTNTLRTIAIYSDTYADDAFGTYEVRPGNISIGELGYTYLLGLRKRDQNFAFGRYNAGGTVLDTGTLYSNKNLKFGTGISTSTGATNIVTASINTVIVPTYVGATVTLDFPSTVSGTPSDLTATVAGAALSDVVTIGVPNGSVTATARYFVWVSASNTVTIRLMTSATENPASGSFKIKCLK